MSKLPQHSGELLALLVKVLRVQSRLTGKNFERWRTAPLPKISSKRSGEAQLKLVHDIVGEVLPRKSFPKVLGLEYDDGVRALTLGVVKALHFFDEAPSKFDWLLCLDKTVACGLARLGVRPLQLSHGGTCAQAPDWFFTGRRPEPVRPVVERAAEKLGAESRRDPLRKSFDTLRGTAQPHLDTLHGIATKVESPLFPLQWALQELLLELELDQVSCTILLADLTKEADSVVDEVHSLSDEQFRDVIAGGLLTAEAAALIRADGAPSERPQA